MYNFECQINFPLKDASGCTALFGACWRGCADIVRLLLDHGAIIDYQNLVRMNFRVAVYV